MKTIYLKLIHTVILGLFILPSSLTAKSLNLVLSEKEDLQFGALTPVLVNDILIFERVIDNQNHIWSYDLTNKTLYPLNITNPVDIRSINGVALIAYEIETTLPGHQTPSDVTMFYKSDGTLENTIDLEMPFDDQIVPLIQSTRNAIYIGAETRFDGGNLEYYTDGEAIYDFAFYYTNMESSPSKYYICEPNKNQYLARFGYRNFYGYFDSSWWSGTFAEKLLRDIRAYKVISTEHGCFFLQKNYPDYELELTVTVKPNAVVTQIPTNTFATNLFAFQSVNERLFALERKPDITLHELNPDTFESINSTVVETLPNASLPQFFPPVLMRSGDLLVYGYQEKTLFFNASLDQLDLISDESQASLLINSRTKTYKSGDYTWVVNDYGNLQASYQKNDDKIIEAALLKNNQLLNKFHSNPRLQIGDYSFNNQDHTFLLKALDHSTGKTGYYLAEDQPQLNKIINGNWYNPDFANQGFSIYQGNRHDGSQYVFITAYLYRDGKPFWLAGNADLSESTQSIDIELYEFNGINFLEEQTSPNRQLFGTINLKLESCNQLKAKLISASDAYELTMYRADNTYYKDVCQ